MGMFDTVIIDYDWPDEITDTEFQTKDLEDMLDTYTINEEGRLVLHKHHHEEVPEEERPYYGKPEWDENPIYRIMGSINSVFDEYVDMNYHGMLEIHNFIDGEWFSYNLKFTDGTLVDIERNEQWSKNR